MTELSRDPGSRVKRNNNGELGVIVGMDIIDDELLIQFDGDDQTEWVKFSEVTPVKWEVILDENTSSEKPWDGTPQDHDSNGEPCGYAMNCPNKPITTIQVPVLGAVVMCSDCAKSYRAIGNSGTR